MWLRKGCSVISLGTIGGKEGRSFGALYTRSLSLLSAQPADENPLTFAKTFTPSEKVRKQTAMVLEIFTSHLAEALVQEKHAYQAAHL